MQSSDLGQVRRTLWAAADQLRANSTLAPSEARSPFLGLIFLAPVGCDVPDRRWALTCLIADMPKGRCDAQLGRPPTGAVRKGMVVGQAGLGQAASRGMREVPPWSTTK